MSDDLTVRMTDGNMTPQDQTHVHMEIFVEKSRDETETWQQSDTPLHAQVAP